MKKTARRVVATAVAAAFGVLAWTSVAFAAPGSCAEVLPTSAVAKGMTATGWTVWRGKEPETFSVEVLGILPNGIAPGRDMIVVDTSSPRYAVTGGIWYGMSGSPVYDDATGKLLGVLAFGLAWGPSSIAGLTPAADLVDVLGYGGAAADSPRPATLSAELVQSIASATGSDADEVSNTLVRLKVPLSASGLTGRAMRKLKRFVRREDLPFLPYAGSSIAAETPPPAAETLDPGDNFAAALSYGDVTLAGIGTTSYVCDGKALAFGHPFFFSGAVTFGANAADALTIVPDSIFGPYKLATVEGTLGRVDQDRLAGIRAVLGPPPAAAAITSAVRALDTGRARSGATDVVFTEEFPFVSFIHLFSNIDSTFDQISGGSSQVAWTVRGRTAEGRRWSLTRSNVYVSRWDISFDSLWEILGALEVIASNPFTDVRFTGLDVSADVEEAVKGYRISKLLVCKRDGCRSRRFVPAVPGQRLRLRVVLAPLARGAASKVVGLTFRVPPAAAFGGAIEVAGAPEGIHACFGEEECEEGAGASAKSFRHLLRLLHRQRTNDILAATFVAGRRMRVVDARAIPIADEGVRRYVRGTKLLFVGSPEGEGGGEEPPPEAVAVE